MFRNFATRFRNAHRSLILASLLAVGALLPSTAVAAPASSLDWAPADASLYVSFLRNREQIETVLKSNWWAKLKAMPAAQMAWQAFLNQWENDGPGEALNTFLEDPENKELLELGLEMVSDEVFFYADAHTAELMDMYMDVSHAMNAVTYATYLRMMIDFDIEGLQEMQQLQFKAMLEPVTADLKKLRAPNVVVGFKIKDTKRAAAQYARLTKLVDTLVENEPMLQGRIREVKVAGSKFLSLRISGDMVPWDEAVGLKAALDAEDQKRFEDLVAHLKKQEMTISVGVHQGYVLLHVGPSTASLAKLGKGKLLADVAAMAPVKKFAERKITGISYASGPMVAASTYSKKDIDLMVKWVGRILNTADLDDADTKRVMKDVNELAQGIKTLLPKPGPASSVSFLSSRERESYTYNWSKSASAVKSKRLSILDHVGGSPLFLIASRSEGGADRYAALVKWLKKGHGYFERFALPKMGEEEREVYGVLVKRGFPLLERLDKINRESLLPALADGQSALLIDGKAVSKQWIQVLPETEKSLPIVSPALVCGVSDSIKFKAAMDGYYKLAGDALALVSDLSDGEVPKIKLPKLTRQNTAAGAIYKLTPPKQIGLDDQIAPNYGLSNTTAAFSLLPGHTARLLARNPLKLKGPLARSDRPLQSAFHVDLSSLVDVVLPWVDMGVQMSAGEGDLGEQAQVALITGAIRQSAELLKAVRGYSSVTYQEQGATVTHSELNVQDVAK